MSAVANVGDVWPLSAGLYRKQIRKARGAAASRASGGGSRRTRDIERLRPTHDAERETPATTSGIRTAFTKASARSRAGVGAGLGAWARERSGVSGWARMASVGRARGSGRLGRCGSGRVWPPVKPRGAGEACRRSIGRSRRNRRRGAAAAGGGGGAGWRGVGCAPKFGQTVRGWGRSEKGPGDECGRRVFRSLSDPARGRSCRNVVLALLVVFYRLCLSLTPFLRET